MQTGKHRTEEAPLEISPGCCLLAIGFLVAIIGFAATLGIILN